MLHEPAAQSDPDPAAPYKSRLGVVMFLIYTAIYVMFVLINVFAPEAMEIIVFSGLNLAVVYGMALIIVALIMALVYNHLCTAKERELADTEGDA